MAKKNPKDSRKVPVQLANPHKERKSEGSKSVHCDVSGCDENIAHSVTKETIQTQLSDLGIKLKDSASGKKVSLCKKHYRKITKTKNKDEKMFKPSLFGKNSKQFKDSGSKKGHPGPLL